MTIDLADLNDNQRATVEWTGSPLLVLAGPGSGKTKVLTMRIAKLIEDSPGQRFRVLGLTFTTKAAAEMRERVDRMIPEARERTLLTTFHSFCANILRQHGSHIGLSPNFDILNQQADREAILLDAKRLMQKEGQDVEEIDESVLPLIDRLMDSCTPEDNVELPYRDRELEQKIAVLYRTYRKLLISRQRVDFPSLLNYVVELLEAKPQIAKHIQTVYKHICVDEFQDTNLAQYMVLEHIIGDNPQNLFVVADDDQIIYQWNGASPERLRQLESDYKMNIIQLPANYRCPPAVIDLANKLIKHNLDRLPAKQPLIAIKTEASKDLIRLLNFDNYDEELDWVSDDIKSRPAIERSECVILARSRKLLEHAVEALMNHDVPASMILRKDEFTSAPFRWLHAILRLANARGDREQLRRACKAFYELEGIHLDIRDIIANASVLGSDNLRSWFNMVLEREELESHTQKFLEAAVKTLVDKMDFLAFMKSAFSWFDELNSKLADQDHEGFVDFAEERIIWQDLQGRIIREYSEDELSLNILLQEFDLSPKMPPIPPGAVRCLTIHGAKGLEFHHVYLLGLAEEHLPSFQSIKKGDESREMQEERRNCFVAITRVQISLALTYSQEYFGWRKEPSRFLVEMGLI